MQYTLAWHWMQKAADPRLSSMGSLKFLKPAKKFPPKKLKETIAILVDTVCSCLALEQPDAALPRVSSIGTSLTLKIYYLILIISPNSILLRIAFWANGYSLWWILPFPALERPAWPPYQD